GHLVAETYVAPNDRLHGRTIAEAIHARGAKCLAHLPATGQEQLPGRIDPEVRLQAGDFVVMCGCPRNLAPLLGDRGDDPRSTHWVTRLSRPGRIGWRSLAELDVMFLSCLAILLVTVAVSTAVLHLGVTKYSITSALFRTVSIMATSAEMYREDFEDKPRMQ